MGNPNSKNPLLCGQRKKSKKYVAQTIVAKAPITSPVVNKSKTTRVALTVTDEDVEKLARNDFAIVKGIRKRSSCTIAVLPKKTVELSLIVRFIPLGVDWLLRRERRGSRSA